MIHGCAAQLAARSTLSEAPTRCSGQQRLCGMPMLWPAGVRLLALLLLLCGRLALLLVPLPASRPREPAAALPMLLAPMRSAAAASPALLMAADSRGPHACLLAVALPAVLLLSRLLFSRMLLLLLPLLQALRARASARAAFTWPARANLLRASGCRLQRGACMRAEACGPRKGGVASPPPTAALAAAAARMLSSPSRLKPHCRAAPRGAVVAAAVVLVCALQLLGAGAAYAPPPSPPPSPSPPPPFPPPYVTCDGNGGANSGTRSPGNYTWSLSCTPPFVISGIAAWWGECSPCCSGTSPGVYTPSVDIKADVAAVCAGRSTCTVYYLSKWGWPFGSSV